MGGADKTERERTEQEQEEAELRASFRNGWILVAVVLGLIAGRTYVTIYLHKPPVVPTFDMGAEPFVPGESRYGDGYPVLPAPFQQVESPATGPPPAQPTLPGADVPGDVEKPEVEPPAPSWEGSGKEGPEQMPGKVPVPRGDGSWPDGGEPAPPGAEGAPGEQPAAEPPRAQPPERAPRDSDSPTDRQR